MLQRGKKEGERKQYHFLPAPLISCSSSRGGQTLGVHAMQTFGRIFVLTVLLIFSNIEGYPITLIGLKKSIIVASTFTEWFIFKIIYSNFNSVFVYIQNNKSNQNF